jgi:hypothetical protein
MVGESNKATIDMVEKADSAHVAGGHDETVNENFFTVVRKYPRVILISVLMSLGPMAFGFDVIIVGVVTAIPAFLYAPRL